MSPGSGAPANPSPSRHVTHLVLFGLASALVAILIILAFLDLAGWM